MRTLTLGVLIVTGGTLAALPFRRYQAIPDASSAPAAVSGPSQSALDDVQQATDSNGAGRQTYAENTLDALPQWSATSGPAMPRRIDIPLTYEDLALPIDQPAAIEKRFDAVAKVHQKKIERDRSAGLVMPKLENLAASEQLKLQRAVEQAPTINAHDPSAGGQLTSTAAPAPTIQRLPKPEPVARQHHWIRQPE